MAHSGGIQTPVGEIAPYIARNTDVPVGTDSGKLTILLRAPPNANVQVVSIGAYGSWGVGILGYFWLVPPDGSTNLSVGSPNSYFLFFSTAVLQTTTIGLPAAYYGADRGFNAPLWIPAGWALAVAPSGTTSGSVATFSAVGIMHPSITAGAFNG